MSEEKTDLDLGSDLEREREKAFSAACLRKDQKPDGALAIYRRLIRTSIGNVVFRLLPKTRARMNALHADAFDDALVDFMHELGPRSHHLRDVPAEFLAFATPRWEKSGVDAATLDLARHEAASFAVEAAPDDPKRDLGEIDLERGVVLSNAVRVVSIDSAWRLLYRDADNDVVDLEIEPIFAAIVTSLQNAKTLREAMTDAAMHEKVALDAALLARVATFLADLGERGAILGGAA